MNGVLAAIVAAEEIDPATVRPSPLSSVVFVFLLVATGLLIWSFVRHLRRAQQNLGPARVYPQGAPSGSASPTAGPGPVEGDSR